MCQSQRYPLGALWGQRVGGEAPEHEPAVLEATAAHHEDELLPAPRRDLREVVVAVVHRLEVHEELERLRPAPLLLGEGDARRANGRTARVAVDVQEGVEAGAVDLASDARHLRAEVWMVPAGDGRLAHEERIALLDTQEPHDGQLAGPARDLLLGGVPGRILGVLHVRAELGDAGLRVDRPVCAVLPHATHPRDGGVRRIGQRLLPGDGSRLEDRSEPLEAAPAAVLALLPGAAQEEGGGRDEALGRPERTVVQEQLGLVGETRAAVPDGRRLRGRALAQVALTDPVLRATALPV